MVAYSFKARFAEPILAGTKDQTIRALGKRGHAGPGQALQLYTGMRTKQCRLIARAECVLQWPVEMQFDRSELGLFGSVWLPDATLVGGEIDRFARRDGFEGFEDMAAFWFDEHGAPGADTVVFKGVLIRWKLERPS